LTDDSIAFDRPLDPISPFDRITVFNILSQIVGWRPGTMHGGELAGQLSGIGQIKQSEAEPPATSSLLQGTTAQPMQIGRHGIEYDRRPQSEM
jgi:hypothetical protein